MQDESNGEERMEDKVSIFKDWNIVKWLLNLLIIGVTIAALGYFVDFIFAAGYVFILLIHEMGHIMAAKGFDIPVTFGGFTPFGAYISCEDYLDSFENAVIALSGPLTGIFAGLMFWAGYMISNHATFILLAMFALLLSFMNLLPVDPFDGGKVASSISIVLAYLPLLGVVWLFVEGNDMIIPGALAIYFMFGIERMRKQIRIQRLLDFEKVPRIKIFIIYICIILITGALLYALLMNYQEALSTIDFTKINV